jgi:hypothetical protein
MVVRRCDHKREVRRLVTRGLAVVRRRENLRSFGGVVGGLRTARRGVREVVARRSILAERGVAEVSRSEIGRRWVVSS